jgi:hypothetical protein
VIGRFWLARLRNYSQKAVFVRLAPVLVGGFSVVAALIAAAAGTTLLFPGGPVDVIWRIRTDDTHNKMLALGWPVGVGLWLVAVIALATSIGGFQQRRWAWWLAVAALAVNAVSDAARIAMGGVVEGLVGVVIAGLILWWLTRPSTRGQFDR